jgi:predicted membrane-bound spermidine synthase
MAAAILLFVGYSWALSAILPVAGELFEGWYLASFSALLALDGLLVGVTFPLAVAVQRQPAASLYAADLWGAALGAFVTGAFLVPMLGLARTVQYSGIFLFAFLCIGVIWILIQRREAKS